VRGEHTGTGNGYTVRWNLQKLVGAYAPATTAAPT
jgi:hypothetical protein